MSGSQDKLQSAGPMDGDPALSLERKAGVEQKPMGAPLFDLPIGHRLLGAKTAKPQREVTQKPETRSGRKGLFRLRWVQFIADRTAWWLLCSLHPVDLGGSERLLVIGQQPFRAAAPEMAFFPTQQLSYHEDRALAAQRPSATRLGRTC